MALPYQQNHAYSSAAAGNNIIPVVQVSLDSGDQVGSSDASSFPRSYDYTLITSYDASNNPLIMQFWKGGSYNTGTGAYTGGTLQFTHYLTYDGSGRFLSRYVLLA